MKKLFTLLLLAGAAIVASSCNDNDDPRFASSGEGCLTIADDSTYWLSRMVVVATDSQVATYLFGGTNTIGLDGIFYGRGPAVKFVYAATDESTLTAQSLTIGDDSTTAHYASFIDFNLLVFDDLEEAVDDTDTDSNFTSICSGSITVTQTGSFYTVSISGDNSDSNAISINYTGYIFAGFYVDTTD